MQVIPIMLKKTAAAITGGLSRPDKMPCPSYDTPTSACVTGSAMRDVEGAVCSDCYACKGRSAMYPAINDARVIRLASLLDPQWKPAMIRLISGMPHFRWHSAGDLQGPAHLLLIVEIARKLPGTEFWLPTREAGMLAEFVRTYGRDAFPSNLTIRLSAMFFDAAVTVPSSLRGIPAIVTANVHHAEAPIGQACQAAEHGGKCGDCRACWDRSIYAVSYRRH